MARYKLAMSARDPIILPADKGWRTTRDDPYGRARAQDVFLRGQQVSSTSEEIPEELQDNFNGPLKDPVKYYETVVPQHVRGPMDLMSLRDTYLTDFPYNFRERDPKHSYYTKEQLKNLGSSSHAWMDSESDPPPGWQLPPSHSWSEHTEDPLNTPEMRYLREEIQSTDDKLEYMVNKSKGMLNFDGRRDSQSEETKEEEVYSPGARLYEALGVRNLKKQNGVTPLDPWGLPAGTFLFRTNTSTTSFDSDNPQLVRFHHKTQSVCSSDIQQTSLSEDIDWREFKRIDDLSLAARKARGNRSNLQWNMSSTFDRGWYPVKIPDWVKDNTQRHRNSTERYLEVIPLDKKQMRDKDFWEDPKHLRDRVINYTDYYWKPDEDPKWFPGWNINNSQIWDNELETYRQWFIQTQRFKLCKQNYIKRWFIDKNKPKAERKQAFFVDLKRRKAYHSDNKTKILFIDDTELEETKFCPKCYWGTNPDDWDGREGWVRCMNPKCGFKRDVRELFKDVTIIEGVKGREIQMFRGWGKWRNMHQAREYYKRMYLQLNSLHRKVWMWNDKDMQHLENLYPSEYDMRNKLISTMQVRFDGHCPKCFSHHILCTKEKFIKEDIMTQCWRCRNCSYIHEVDLPFEVNRTYPKNYPKMKFNTEMPKHLRYIGLTGHTGYFDGPTAQ
ncbi:hypothetical protein AAMO2058_000903000 [Amorphochlora amoebiformis]